MKLRSDLTAYLLAAVCIIGIVVLVALGHDVPSVLEATTLFAIGGGVGVTVPQASGSLTTSTPNASPVAPAAEPVAAAAPAAATTVSTTAGVTSTFGGE